MNSNEFIIHNIKKDFKNGHTHIKNFHTAKFLIDLAVHNTIPNKSLNKYLYESLIRISTDPCYIKKLKALKARSRLFP